VSALAPRQPELPAAPEPAADVTSLVHGATLTAMQLDSGELREQRARGLTVREAVLRAVDLSGSQLEQLSLIDVECAGANLSNVAAERARIDRAALGNCRVTGIRLTDAVLRDVSFTGCRIDLASFGLARLERVTFDDCRLNGTEFMQAQLQDVRFHGCEMAEVDFRGATLRRCEARGCELEAIRGADRLRGLSLPWPEIVANAGIWAAALGIAALEE
jgi:uncharacterized protein YjbI with pentapeptide repeats